MNFLAQFFAALIIFVFLSIWLKKSPLFGYVIVGGGLSLLIPLFSYLFPTTLSFALLLNKSVVVAILPFTDDRFDQERVKVMNHLARIPTLSAVTFIRGDLFRINSNVHYLSGTPRWLSFTPRREHKKGEEPKALLLGATFKNYETFPKSVSLLKIFALQSPPPFSFKLFGSERGRDGLHFLKCFLSGLGDAPFPYRESAFLQATQIGGAFSTTAHHGAAFYMLGNLYLAKGLLNQSEKAYLKVLELTSRDGVKVRQYAANNLGVLRAIKFFINPKSKESGVLHAFKLSNHEIARENIKIFKGRR